MGNIVGKQFRVVASKNYATALAESVKEGNQAKFYLAQKDGKALDGVTATTDNDRNTLIINGNTIQGVSNNDISKLDAITDVSKLFVYKGSVSPSEFKALSAYDVVKGDVYNVTGECEVNEIKYPAYTNFICINVSQLGPQTSIIEWDSLGGTMQIGTTVAPIVNDSRLSYQTTNNIPISSFEIVLGSDTGIVADDYGTIRLQLTTKHFTKLNDNTLYIDSIARPLESVYLDINNSNGLWINGNSLDLKLSTAHISSPSDDTLEFYSSTPIKALALHCKDGIYVKDAEEAEGQFASLSLKLSSSTYNYNDFDDVTYKQKRCSGLGTNSNNELFLALATGSVENNYIPNALLTLYTDTDRNITGGLIIDGDKIYQWLTQNTEFNNYINSLIDAKLQAQ